MSETAEQYTISASVPNDDYHAMPGVSSSRLKVFMDDVREYWYQFLSGKYVQPQKAHFDFGTAVHDLALLGDAAGLMEIPSYVLAVNGAKSGNKWKDFAAENSDKILLKSHEYDAVNRCVEALYSHPVAGPFLRTPGKCEHVFTAHDGLLELLTRCKPDKLIGEVVIDLKTTEQGTKASKFVKHIANYGYHFQECFYRRVLAANGVNVKAFVFVAVQVDPPHTIDCYTISREFLRLAEVQVENSLFELAERTRANDWLPRNHSSIVELEPPRFLKYEGEYDA